MQHDLLISMNFYSRKLYALLHDTPQAEGTSAVWNQLSGLSEQVEILNTWWDNTHNLPQAIASSSDRVNLEESTSININTVKHPISGQERNITSQSSSPEIPPDITSQTDTEKLFWWFWRFYPELIRQQYNDFFLYPAHSILPDCPLHSYKSTVSALVGAMYPEEWQAEPENKHEHPYLLLFTFSPVQEFIKASRKFVDFWAGSYLLHYLSAKLCWHIAETYGPDSVITPSLWGQEIIDALISQKYPDFNSYFRRYTGNTPNTGKTPKERFKNKQANSLSTAGFPNIIVALVPGQEKASKLGEDLGKHLKIIWTEIGDKVKDKIREQIIETLRTDRERIWSEIEAEFPIESQPIYERELEKWLHKANWEWNKLWQMQLENTWEIYWTIVPLGNPSGDLSIDSLNEEWLQQQKELSQSRQPIPTPAERELYKYFNVGTWWGSLQNRLGQSIQAVKNTRNWRIPPAPGERSTLSGQFSAVHPQLLYNPKFQEGGGLPLGSLRLFWRVMAEAFPGLFNGSERLNAIELTKRMAWRYGGVAEDLGIDIKAEDETNYENLIRFPNLSSIASARFAHDHPELVRKYWRELKKRLGDYDRFGSLTCRPFQIPKTDKELNPNNVKGQDYNGVMFSSKWLVDDLGLQKKDEITALREAIATAHKDCGFGDSSPADWWVIVVGDGDSMGKYVSGSKLKNYEKYLIKDAIAKPTKAEDHKKFNENLEQLKTTKKRMGPASHVGLNRALLDFSNRLVPYLTEKRCCGRVIYSGGDDVLAVLPLEDLPLFLRSLRACWSGKEDPGNENNQQEFSADGGYWTPTELVSPEDLVHRPYFTMGQDATMSLGIVIAHKSIPLPTVLETLWEAESERAKKLLGAGKPQETDFIPSKDGLCFRVIYGSGNVLEALMKGHLLEDWCNIIGNCGSKEGFSPLLYRLAEELPRRCAFTENTHLFREAAKVIISRRDESKKLETVQQENLLNWLDAWENWAYRVNSDPKREKPVLGTQPDDLGYLLRFTAFWCDRMAEREKWSKEENQ